MNNVSSPRIKDLEALALAKPENRLLSRADGRGLGNAPLLMVYDRDLQVEDLEALAKAPRGAQDSNPPTVKSLRHSHHLLARAIAEGASNEEASFLTGYDPQRISSIRTAPAFAELVSFYATQETAKDLDLKKRLESFGLSSLDILQERLEEDPERFTNRELKELAELGLSNKDSGLGPKGLPVGGSVAPISISVSFVTPTASGGSALSGSRDGDGAKIIEGTTLDIVS